MTLTSDKGIRPERPVTPPILPPDFPDIPQNPSSELQPPSDPSASPDKVAGAAPEAGELELPGRASLADLRAKITRLRDKIKEITDTHPELRDLADEIALEQGIHIEVGVPFLERVNGKLQERARAIIERRPDLERFFED